jgi:formylglycine-generating enzyme required for sulfatase activity
MVRALITLALLALLPSGAQAAKRVALVVGNSAYEHTPPLENPRNDATDMATALRKLGIEVIVAFDLNKAAFDQKIRDFATALQSADTGVFFYAGHGLQVAGRNYLAPVDAKLTAASALDFEMVRLDLVLRAMEHETHTNIVFLDACRNNPLVRNLARALGTRSGTIGRGLAAMDSGIGTLISFSTQPGNVALDGTGRNSPFADALVKQLSASSADLNEILINVRKEVIGKTAGKQVPWENSSLTGRFYFKAPPPAASRPAPAPRPLSEAAEAWDRTKDSVSIPALVLFMGRYDGTYYADLARLRIEQLEKEAALARPTAALPTRPVGSAVKDTFKDCAECPEMAVLPPGKFVMGSSDGDANERPVHEVTISKPFAIGKFEVTFAQWDACVAASACGHQASDARWGGGGYPVINVSWHDAQEYVAWLSKTAGRAYRLPNEAEWEYAARAGTTTPYFTGTSITVDQANFGAAATGGSRRQTIEVGSLGKPNAFGLHDMLGNVWEWVADCYVDSVKYADAHGSNQGSAQCRKRSVRGGSWRSGARGIRASSRDGVAASTRINFIGFRVASSP